MPKYMRDTDLTKVKAKVGFTLDDLEIRCEENETASIPTALAKQWAEEGLVEIVTERQSNYIPPRHTSSFPSFSTEDD